MKKLLIRLFTLLMAVSIVFQAKAGQTETKALGGSVDMGNVIQMGTFEGTSHYVVFYPKALESSDQTWPVAVWANGTMCAPALYTSLLAGVAEQGYVVVASSDVMSADGKSQREAIDWIFDQSMDEESVFCGKIDPQRIGAFGHSQGGRSSVNAAAADSRISCIVSIAGSSYGSEAEKLSTPALFLTGSKDLVVLSSLWVKPAYNKCKGPAVYASLDGGIHTSVILNADPYIHYVTQWFNAWLNNDSDSMSVFKGNGLRQDKAWKDYQAKNLNASGVGSVFSGGSFWKFASIAELVVIVLLVVLFRKGGKNDRMAV